MAIVISGVNNNDKITATDGLIDVLSGVSFNSEVTVPSFKVGSNIQLGNAGIATATTFVGNLTGNVTGNVTGNINATSNLLLQIGGSEKFRVGSSGQLGIGGANYGTSGQVLTSGGSGSASTWTTPLNLNNATDNRIITSAGGATLNGEANLTFNGTTLGLTGSQTISADLDVDGHTNLDNVSVAGIITATAFKGDMVPATYHGGRRNMFINGDFIISQRGDRDPHANQNNGANNLGYGGPDHVQVVSNLGAYYARQKNSASAPRTQAGATCSYELDVTTANASPGSNAYTFLNVMWNGNEAGRLLYGTSSARPVTISFWCYSNKTGNFVINMRNYSTDRQINQVVSISSSNTWEYKTVTFVGDTASAISATLDARWAIEFWLDAGTDYTSGSNQSVWGTRVDNRRASGCTLAIASSTSNYFRMALLQVEMGPYATPFEFRTYSEYLHDCEYYFQKPFSSRGSNQAFAIHIWGHKIADTYALRVQSMMRPTEMRINPTDYFHDNNPSGLTAQRYQTQGSDYEYTYNVGMSIGSNKKEFSGGTKYPYGVNGVNSAESAILFAYDFESYAEL